MEQSVYEIVPIEESCEDVLTTYPCSECTYSSKWKSNLKRHRTVVHKQKTNCQTTATAIKDKEIHVCDQCGKSFTSRYGMSLHIKSKHQEIFRFKCGVCEKGFQQLWDYRGHLASHVNSLEKTCNTCKKTFKYQTSLNRHVKICNVTDENNNSKFECNVCQKKFKSNKNLIDHMRGAHSGRLFQCDVCLKFFKWRSSLSYHRQHAKHD